MARPYNDITGKKFGRLTALRPVRLLSNRKFGWGCLCDCGRYHYAMANNLIDGHVRSCGCIWEEERHYASVARQALSGRVANAPN
jgi:hypothetical protein